MFVAVEVAVAVAVAVEVGVDDEAGDAVGVGNGVPAPSVQTEVYGFTELLAGIGVTDGFANPGKTSPPPSIITVPVGLTYILSEMSLVAVAAVQVPLQK